MLIVELRNGAIVSELPIKEEYDKYTYLLISNYDVCGMNPTDWAVGIDDPNLGALRTLTEYWISRRNGDGVCKMLEGLLTKQETTGDLGYLYKFIHVSLCKKEGTHR